MRRPTPPLLYTLLCCLIIDAAPVAAAELKDEAGHPLTPLGAIREGNPAGTIPAWQGGLTRPPPGWSAEMGYIDPYAAEKPLVTITAATAEAYRNNLPAGLLALLRQYPDFRLPLYPTHRSAALPAAVIEQAQKAHPVTLRDFAIVNPDHSHIPFPQPHNGLEAIWNHLVRYVGGGIERTAHSFPVRANGEWYKIGFMMTRIYDENMDHHTTNRLFSARGHFTEPATLRGTTFLVHEPVDQVEEKRAAWIYNAGMRRVRRAPDLGYDGINDGSEGMLTTDQVDGYNGAPDRYDWKLIGRREMIVPYNTYKIGDKHVKYVDVLRKGTVNSDLMRYELHRVWVVEATLKPGTTHIYGRRVFYLDEDSWNVLIEEAYATRGTLWRVALHGLIQYYDAQTPWYRFSLYHDLDSGGYLLSGLDNELGTAIRFNISGHETDFSPDALRRTTDR